MFVALQAAGRLMPDEGDRHRDALERNARAASRRPHCAPFALADAFMRREQDVAIRLADRVDMRLLVSAAGDEVWVAVSTRGAVGDYIDEPVRNVLFRMAFDAVHKAHPLLGRDPSPAQDPRRVRSLQQLLRSSDYPVSGLRDAVGRQEEAVDRFGRRHADVSQGRVASGGWPRVETEEDPVVRRTGRRETEHRAINDQ